MAIVSNWIVEAVFQECDRWIEDEMEMDERGAIHQERWEMDKDELEMNEREALYQEYGRWIETGWK